MILVVLGGSCSGKTEFALVCQKYGFQKVITNTTRKKRVDDKENSYHFLTKEEFMHKINNNEMIEYVEYNGNYYGSSIDSLSKNCVIVLEPIGFRALKKKFGSQVYSILLDVSEEERYSRGLSRGDDINVLLSRIKEDGILFDSNLKNEVDLVLTNLQKQDIPKIIEDKLLDFYTK